MKAARETSKFKVENNGAVVYVETSLTVHNPLFCVHKLSDLIN